MDGVQRFVSRPEQVEAVRVTEENIEQMFRYYLFPPLERRRLVGGWMVTHPDGTSDWLPDDVFQRRFEVACIYCGRVCGYVPNEPGGVS